MLQRTTAVVFKTLPVEKFSGVMLLILSDQLCKIGRKEQIDLSFCSLLAWASYGVCVC